MPTFGCIPLHQTGQGRHLSRQRTDLPFRRGPLRAGIGLARLRIGLRFVGQGQGFFGARRCFDRDRFGFQGRLICILCGGHGRFGCFGGLTRAQRLRFAFLQGRAIVVHQALRGLMARRQTGDVFCELTELGFALLKDCGGIFGFRICSGKCVFVSVFGGTQLFGLGLQPRDRFARIAVQVCFTLQIQAKLFDPVFKRLYAPDSRSFLLAERIKSDLKPLQHRGCDRLFFTKRGQRGFCCFAQLRRITRISFRLGRCRRAIAQIVFGAQACVFRFSPASIQQEPFSMAQLFTDRAIAGRLLSLPRQLRQLRRQLFDYVIDTGEIGLSPVEFQLRLMAALIEARDARRLFQNATARFRLGVDQLRDLTLPHERWRMRAS